MYLFHFRFFLTHIFYLHCESNQRFWLWSCRGGNAESPDGTVTQASLGGTLTSLLLEHADRVFTSVCVCVWMREISEIAGVSVFCLNGWSSHDKCGWIMVWTLGFYVKNWISLNNSAVVLSLPTCASNLPKHTVPSRSCFTVIKRQCSLFFHIS